MFDYATARMQQEILSQINLISSQLDKIYLLLGVISCFLAIKLIFSIVRSCL